jgi:hypothetical protein
MVVSLSIGQWAARKYDKKVTDEVTTQHQASPDAVRVNKQLAAKEHLEPFQKVISKLKAFHYAHSIPWGDDGSRLITPKIFEEYANKIDKFKAEYLGLVPDLISNIEAIKTQARIDLNGMYNEADYPSKSELEEKFYVKVNFMPVPENEWRCNLSDTEKAFLSKQFEAEINSRLAAGVKHLWERIADQLAKMKDRLTTIEKDKKTGQDKPAKFHDSLFNNLKELIEVLPKLNVTDDPAITQACAELSKLMVDPQKVRENQSVRAQKADQVNDMLNKFNSFFN